MKQLYKQSGGGNGNGNQSPSSSQIPYTSKPWKQPRSPSLPRSFGQRLFFVLLGALIASTLFLIHPYLALSSPIPDPDADPTTARLESHHRLLYRHRPDYSLSVGPKRVPVGLKKPSKRIVVTGGAGFVGSHLVDRLLDRGDSVIVIDNFFTGRKDNLVHRFGDPRFELIRHDVVEPILLEVDQIYHLACPASPVYYKYNPIKTIRSFFRSRSLFV